MRSILVGMVLGVGAGILYAPVPGNKARKFIRNNMTRFAIYAREFMHDRKEHLDRAMVEFEPRRRYYEALDEPTMEAVAGR